MRFLVPNNSSYDLIERSLLRTDLLKVKELDMQADIEETRGIYEHDSSFDAGGVVNARRGSVRPVLTYAFFLLFCAISTPYFVKNL